MAVDALHTTRVKALFTQKRNCTAADNRKLKLLALCKCEGTGRASDRSQLIARSRHRRIGAVALQTFGARRRDPCAAWSPPSGGDAKRTLAASAIHCPVATVSCVRAATIR